MRQCIFPTRAVSRTIRNKLSNTMLGKRWGKHPLRVKNMGNAPPFVCVGHFARWLNHIYWLGINSQFSFNILF